MLNNVELEMVNFCVVPLKLPTYPCPCAVTPPTRPVLVVGVYTLPPIYKLLPIPTPPVTTNAPVVVEVAKVEFNIVNVVVVPVDDPLPLVPALPV